MVRFYSVVLKKKVHVPVKDVKVEVIDLKKRGKRYLVRAEHEGRKVTVFVVESDYKLIKEGKEPKQISKKSKKSKK